jgi:hypothetical protein
MPAHSQQCGASCSRTSRYYSKRAGLGCVFCAARVLFGAAGQCLITTASLPQCLPCDCGVQCSTVLCILAAILWHFGENASSINREILSDLDWSVQLKLVAVVD